MLFHEVLEIELGGVIGGDAGGEDSSKATAGAEAGAASGAKTLEQGALMAAQAPLVAVLNFRVVRLPNVPPEHRPGRLLTWLGIVGLVFLAGFGLVWMWVRWGH